MLVKSMFSLRGIFRKDSAVVGHLHSLFALIPGHLYRYQLSRIIWKSDRIRTGSVLYGPPNLPSNTKENTENTFVMFYVEFQCHNLQPLLGRDFKVSLFIFNILQSFVTGSTIMYIIRCNLTVFKVSQEYFQVIT